MFLMCVRDDAGVVTHRRPITDTNCEAIAAGAFLNKPNERTGEFARPNAEPVEQMRAIHSG